MTPDRNGILSTPRPLRAWSPSPLVRASIWLHGAAGVALALQPAAWPGLLGLVALNHAVLAGGMHVRSNWLGPNLARLPPSMGPAVAVTFDDGPHPEVTPRVLDLLDAHEAFATFFLIGDRAARHPQLVRDILGRGHAIGNHTHRHPSDFACFGPWRIRRELAEAQGAIADACGKLPAFFRAPMGLRNPLLDPVLAMEGLSLASWTRRGYDTVDGNADRVVGRLARGLAPGDMLLLHDATSRATAQGGPVVLEVLPKLLRRIREAGLRTASLDELTPRAEACPTGATPARAAAPASRTSA